MKGLIIKIIWVSLVLLTYIKLQLAFTAEYEAGRCAGYGYQEDCKTPLTAQDTLDN